MENFTEQKTTLGLYDPQFEHDACGIGAVVDIKGRKSHQTVDDALSIVERLEHRAGKDAEGKTGDGVGILLQISHKFFSKVAEELNIRLGNEREYGVGMFFFPQNEHLRAQAMKLFEVVTRKEGLEFLAWREVPVDPDAVGQKARDCMPAIWQCFIKKPAKVSKGIEFDRRLYIVRRVFEQASNGTYVPSLSSRTIVYKGMFLVHDLRRFYADLQDPDYESAIGMVHSRFSTNTNPSWMRAHPNRFILHNGEINTIKGNTDAMLAREESISSPILQDDMNKILPIINTSGSDSAMLDNTLEFMVMNGMDLPLAVMITIPEPWENNKNISQKKRDFYQYYATMLEPWDGPAAILFSDGDVMGAVLDRNGLRPSRYYITKDGRMILSSEVGVLECDPENILVKERLRPGKMLLVDTVKGEVVDDEKLKELYASREPYGEWIDRNLVQLSGLKIPNVKVESYTGEQLTRLQKVFGYKYEDVNTMILAMARAGAEPSGAMGTDTPLAVLSSQHPPLFNYFKQRFAQVTNPPIDAIREKVVTSTSVYIGAHGNLLEDKPENCKVLKVHNPILTNTDLLKIKYMNVPGFKVATVSINYYKNTSLEKAIDRVFLEVDRAYKEGANIIILSDRDVDEYHVTIPSLLAVSAVSQYLIRTKKSTALALILESAEPREVHHFATLLGYGACAINPYLAHETIGQLIDEGLLDKDYYAAVQDYDNAILNGIVKIGQDIFPFFKHGGTSLKAEIQEGIEGAVHQIGGDRCQQSQQDQRLQNGHDDAAGPAFLQLPEDFDGQWGGSHRGDKEHPGVAPQIVAGQSVGQGQTAQAEQGGDGAEGVLDAGGIEEDKADHDQEKHVNVLQELCPGQGLTVPELFRRQEQGEEQSPEDERPGGTVPQARQQPDDENIPKPLAPGDPVTSQGDVHIVPEPAAQAHVPPPPEFGDAGGNVGIVEVLREVKPEDAAQADGHVAVAGEVEIEMKNVSRRVEPGEEDGGLRAVFVGGDQFIEDIGQQHLFGKADDEAAGAVSGVGQGVGPVLQLGGDVGIPDDGSGDQLGEHCHVGRQVDEIPLGGCVAPVNVDDVAQNLKGVEADADGQGHVKQGEGQPCETVEAADEEIGVFAVAQQTKADGGGGI